MILVLLVCMLLVSLTQMTSLKQRQAKLTTLIEQAKQDEAKLQELNEYLQSDEYVRDWAEKNDRIEKDEDTWIPK